MVYRLFPLNPPPSFEKVFDDKPTSLAFTYLVFPILIAVLEKSDKISQTFNTSSFVLSGDTFTTIILEEMSLNLMIKFFKLSKSSLKHLPSSVFGQLMFIS